MKFAICNELYQGWPLESAFAHAAKTGYQGIELAPFTLAEDIRTLSAAKRTAIRQKAHQEGLSITGLHWLLAKPPGMHVHNPDVEVRRRTVAYLEALIEFCAELGGSVLVFGSPQQRAILPNDTWHDAWQRSLEVFARLAEQAVRNKVIIALEPLAPRDGCNFINTMAEGSAFVRTVNSPGLRLHLDVKAMSAEGRPVAETIRLEGGRYLAYFHANDPNLRGPGMGNEDFTPIAQALRDVKYDGWVSVEAFDFSPGPEQTAVLSFAAIEKAFRFK